MRTAWISVALGACVACTGQLVPLSGGVDAGAGGGGDGETAIAFRPSVHQDLKAAGCLLGVCHGSTAVPMTLVADPASDDQWIANYEEVRSRAGTPSSSPLIDKALGAGGHVASIAAGDEMLDAWAAWVAAGAPYQAPAPGGGDAGTPGGGGDAGTPGGGGGDVEGLSWRHDIVPLLVRNDCRSCHGGQNVQGAYSLDTYEAALGFGTDNVPNIIPGDPDSLLAQYCAEGHNGISAPDALIVITWIANWNAQP
jgi:hypothetical protein